MTTTSKTMTPEAATALRKPFPPESIGKLPKRSKNKDGSWGPTVNLDFVGHAAVTDRLLAVDPEWSWEPLALDERGLPALDGKGNLWIKLTIRGVTRIGVGDGASAKECIGDALRNAAMRFGVALDLWSKNDLIEFAQAAQAKQAPAKLRWVDLTAAMNDTGVAKESALELAGEMLGHPVASLGELTDQEQIDGLVAKIRATVEDLPAEGGVAA